MTASFDKEVNHLLKKAFMFFCHEEIFISMEPTQIVIGPLAEKHILTEEKFYDF
jgi:hypothetical protein